MLKEKWPISVKSSDDFKYVVTFLTRLYLDRTRLKCSSDYSSGLQSRSHVSRNLGCQQLSQVAHRRRCFYQLQQQRCGLLFSKHKTYHVQLDDSSNGEACLHSRSRCWSGFYEKGRSDTSRREGEGGGIRETAASDKFENVDCDHELRC